MRSRTLETGGHSGQRRRECSPPERLRKPLAHRKPKPQRHGSIRIESRYLGWPVCHGRGRSAAVEMEAAVCTPIAVVAAMSLGTLFYKEQLDYLEQSHGSIRIESRMARISATSFRGEFGDQFASIIRRVPSMSRIQNCSVRPGSLL